MVNKVLCVTFSAKYAELLQKKQFAANAMLFYCMALKRMHHEQVWFKSLDFYVDRFIVKLFNQSINQSVNQTWSPK